MRKLLCLMLAVIMIASVAVVAVNAAGDDKATVTLINAKGEETTQTYAVGETFTAYTYLNTGLISGGGIASLEGIQLYTQAILAVDEPYVTDDEYDYGMIDDADTLNTVFPVLGDSNTIANLGHPGEVYYNASKPNINNAYKFSSDDSGLIIIKYKVIAAGEATIESKLNTLAVSDKELTRIISQGQIVNPNFTMPIALSEPAAPAGFTLSGKATSYKTNDGVDDVTLTLTGSDVDYTDTVKVTASYKGVAASTAYTFENVPAGNYALKVEKGNHVTREYTVAVSADTTQDVKINPIGDADGNGRVNSADAKAAFRHAGEDTLIEDEYLFKCADVVKPSKNINSADAKGIFQHVNETKTLWTVTAE